MQQDFFDEVHHIVQPNPDPPSDSLPFLFNAIADRGQEMSERNIASERDLEYVLRSIFETPVAGINSKLVQIPAASSEFDLAGGVIFENHANTISEANEEVLADLAQAWLSGSEKVVLPTHADQICMHQDVSGRRELRFTMEYKTPHKLTAEHLRRGLRQLPPRLEVVNRATVQADPEGKVQYESDWRTEAAVSQKFGYMIEKGLEFSYISTSETIVFLRVAEDNPETVYFHPADLSTI